MTVDQGRYQLAAIVADRAVLGAGVADQPQAHVVELAQGKAMVPVTTALITAVAASGTAVVPPETGFWLLSPGVLQLLEDVSRAGPLAYLEADYVGYDGRQTAAVWEAGQLTDGPYILNRSEPFPRAGGGPIGAALRRLGVVAAGRRDEFVVLGLGQQRSTEDWA
ncbi:MAG TPA: hypothetical protein VFR07_03935 [Mycobacteriales bacterium]|jgi:hypothetical protein|nr:hypothetical protein [Mycobacteriales bacterium]